MGSNKLMIDRLKGEMKRVGVNARELSDLARVGRSFVYDILSGKSANPTTKKISAVADALGVSVPYLIAGISNDNEIIENLGESFSSIPVIAIETGDKGEYLVSTEPTVNSYFFKKIWIDSSLDSNPKDLRVVFIRGDSMYPTLQDNDMVLVDISKTVPNPPGIFIVFDGAGLVTKRLEHIRKDNNPRVLVKSDNSQYTHYECNLSDMDIVGKVVWFSRRM